MGRSSPFVAFIGGRVEEWGEGYMRVSLVLKPEHANPHQRMHGGVICALLDEALGGAIASLRGLAEMWAAPHITVEMNVSFLSSARPGDEIVVEGRVLRLGRLVAVGEAEARRRGDDGLIAKGRATFVISSQGQ